MGVYNCSRSDDPLMALQSATKCREDCTRSKFKSSKLAKICFLELRDLLLEIKNEQTCGYVEIGHLRSPQRQVFRGRVGTNESLIKRSSLRSGANTFPP